MKGDFHVRFDGSGEGQVLPATLPGERYLATVRS